MTPPRAFPPIADYAIIGDGATCALVAVDGAIDWCCMPRFDSGSCFGRLLDRERGGAWTLSPTAAHGASRRYLDDSLVLETTFETDRGRASVLDFFVRPSRHERSDAPLLIRLVKGRSGHVDFGTEIAPRFDYGATVPWLGAGPDGAVAAVGGDDALCLWAEVDLVVEGAAVAARFSVEAGQSVGFAARFARPEEIAGPDAPRRPRGFDGLARRTTATWRRWSRSGAEGVDPLSRRSALTLRALTYEATGAVAAAATTSLPEQIGGARNWDYRFSWIRDAVFSVRALVDLGHESDAEAFRRFVQRSSAGHAEELRVLYGIGGERDLAERELTMLEGYRGSRPVRVGNAASAQSQHDIWGHLLELNWRWHARGHSPDDDYWVFLRDIADIAARDWRKPDRGIWEWRGEPRHFVHSKVLCWNALTRAIDLAEQRGDDSRTQVWERERRAIAAAVKRRGLSGDGRHFVQDFGVRRAVDAALLRLPVYGFIDYDDPLMLATADAVRDQLGRDGLIRRYATNDGLGGGEGTFVACTFWLAHCLARQGRREEAEETYERGCRTANELGLFAEEYDPQTETMLGNFPQALSHYSQIEAALALA